MKIIMNNINENINMYINIINESNINEIIICINNNNNININNENISNENNVIMNY